MATKKKKTGLLIVILLLCCSNIEANSKNKLFLYFENLRTEESFLVQHFKEFEKDHHRIFDAVEVLNDLATDEEGELALKNLLGLYSQSPAIFLPSKSGKKINKEFQLRLDSLENYLVRISIEQKGNAHLAFNFKLHKIIQVKSEHLSSINQPIHLLEGSGLSSSCLLLNRQSDHLVLVEAIEKLLAKDFNPKALIHAENRAFTPDNTYNFIISKPIVLDGTFSLHPGAKNATVSYKWRLITPNAKVDLQNEAQSAVRLLPEHPERVRIELNISVEGKKLEADTATINFIYTSALEIKEDLVPPRASLFQYLKQHRDFKYNKKDTFEVSLENKVTREKVVPADYELFVQNKKKDIPVRYSMTTADSAYRIRIDERIGHYIRQPYNIIARYQRIEVVREYVRYKRYKLVPFKLNVGTEYFLSEKVFGVKKDPIDRVSLITKGSIYLIHIDKPKYGLGKKSNILPQKSALFLELGAINDVTPIEGSSGRISYSGLKSSLKFQYSYAVFSAHYAYVSEKHYLGFGLGAYIEKAGIDISIPNIYFRIDEAKELTVSIGVSVNVLFWLSNNYGKLRKKSKGNASEGYAESILIPK